MNERGKLRDRFLFGFDFKFQNGFFCTPEEAESNGIYFTINNIKNQDPHFDAGNSKEIIFTKSPVSYATYAKSFGIVRSNLLAGNSFLTNLTCRTPISTNLSFEEIYCRSRAKYKLLLQDSLVLFSPEIFVQIEGDRIRSFPMKGTIDASIEDAASIILNDPKEKAEHYTIVDLIRNDLSILSDEVEVTRFRYIDRIDTSGKSLLQVSSEITGVLHAGWQDEIGTLISRLLPAGSISGAPKKKTVEIIEQAEGYDRGYYTGVFGYFDGERLDSGVMIRMIRREGDDLFFCSGGGITVNSRCREEYQELIDKVYVPIV